jgi:hypothetical protein
MTNTRVKISSILESQLPEFIREEFPLVKEFFTQYYESVDHQGAPVDILQNIDKYVKVEEITNLTQSTTLKNDIEYYNTTIDVESTQGFPQKYGLLQIDDEIITYGNKTDTSFIDCSRGFSGITSYRNGNTSENLIFSTSQASSHTKDSRVKNLSVVFLNEFLTKVKKQFSPGFESRTLDPNLDQNLFIKQSKDFYSSKGTDNSFKILFQALYNKNVEIIKPREYMFRPSDARYRVTRDIIIEPISGDPLSLLNKTLKQDVSDYSSKAFGSIAYVEKFTKDSRDYYYLNLDYEFNKDIDLSGSVFGNFSIHPKTSVINVDTIALGSNTLDVDSTVGFPNSGSLILTGFVYDDGELVGIFDQTVTYGSKTLTQFLNCQNVPELIKTNKYEVRIDDYAYGTNDDGEQVTVRVCGSLSDIELETNTYFYNSGDDITNIVLGQYKPGVKENDWLVNLSTTYNVQNIVEDSNIPTYRITTYDSNSISRFDNVNLNTTTGLSIGAKVISVLDSRTFMIGELSSTSFIVSTVESVTRKLSKVETFGNQTIGNFSANVQNVYFDNDDVYVASPSLPKYEERLDIRSFKISTVSGSYQDSESLTVNFHPFYTGDAIYYSGVSTSNRLNILDGVYFVKKIDDKTVRLAKSRSNIDNNIFVSITGDITNNIIELHEFKSQTLEPQNLIRKISTPINDTKTYPTESGFVGILKNGVEVLNYKSKDYVYYGNIEDVEVTSSGKNYDVINPPILTISDKVGTGASAVVSVTGSLQEIQIIDSGFDYIQEPVISISGGNGSGARVSANLLSVDHKVTFNSSGLSTSVDVINSIIGFTSYHKFRDGEKVVYETNGQTAVAGLVTNSTYFVSVQTPSSIRLYKTYNDAIAKSSNYVGIGSTYGDGNHTFRASLKKKVISSINVEDGGSGYSSNETIINTLDLNSYNDVIFSDDLLRIKNHGYESGEVVVYNPPASPIGGLSSTSYYVTKIDDNHFKLSQVSVGSTNKDFYYQTKQYINLTSKGSGIHRFNYEPITVSVSGILGFSTSPDNLYQAILQPKFRGEIVSVNLISGGTSYGSDNILNFNRQPVFQLNSGSSATLIPIISNGRITEVLVNSPGYGYNSPPDLLIDGDGNGAILTPVLSNGIISRIVVVNGGYGYSSGKTSVVVIPSGSEAQFSAKIKSWNVNIFERMYDSNQLTIDDGVIAGGLNSRYGLQYSHVYAARSLRKILKATKTGQDGDIITRPDLDADSDPNNTYHSPIIGWAYDGNPIYGPYGYLNDAGGFVTRMKSSYTLNLSPNRPGGFPRGFFVEDYSYNYPIGEDYLDEHNGRYCITPEFPNGVYAYFATISNGSPDTDGAFRNQRRPTFPYIIGNTYKSKPEIFNYQIDSNQNDIDLNTTSWSRNTKPYNLTEKNSSYDYLVNPIKLQKENAEIVSTSRGKIDSVKIISPGQDYQVGDRVIFNNANTSGNGASAKVSEISGKLVNTVSVATSTLNNVTFIPYGDQKTFIGIVTVQHNYLNNTPIIISGLSTSNTDLNGVKYIQVKSSTLVLNVGVSSAGATGIVTTFKISGDLSNANLIENDVLGIGTEKVRILKVNRPRLEVLVEREYENTVGSSHSQFSVLTEFPRKFYVSSGVNTSLNYRRNKQVFFEPEISVGVGTTSGVGISSTLLLGIIEYNTPVSIGTSSQTILIFNNPLDIDQYVSGGYIRISDSTTAVGMASTAFHTTFSKIVAVGNTSITIDFNSSTLNGIGVTAFVDKFKTSDIPTKTIFIPNHELETGTEVTYETDGSALSVSLNGYSNIQPLSDFSSLFVLKINENLIGLATSRVGLGSTGSVVGLSTLTSIDTLFFNGIGTSRNHSFVTNYNNVLTGKVTTHKATVSTASTHGLKVLDKVNIDVVSGLSTTIVVEYNSTNRRMVINPSSFASGDVNIANDTIAINNHGYYNGQKVIYTTSSTGIGGLENNGIYFVIVYDENNIRLASSYYNATSVIPTYINLTSASSGKILPINPKLTIFKNQTINFDLSSSSLSFSGLSAFDFDIFYGSGLNHIFKSDEKNSIFEVVKTGTIGFTTAVSANLQLKLTEDTPKILYYGLSPSNLLSNSPDNLGIIRDTEVFDANAIEIQNSLYSGTNTIVGVTTNTFTYNLIQSPEKQSYTNLSNSNCTYSTNSASASGPISKIEVTSGGYGYRSTPGISSVITKNGSSATLVPFGVGIGSILSIRFNDIGYDYSADKTLRPTANLPQILKVSPLSEFSRIGITSSGKYYTKAPSLVVIDGILNTQIKDVDLFYKLGDTEVSIARNTTTMRFATPSIIPINNSNAIKLTSLVYNAGVGIVTAGIAVSYSDAENFPFSVGDKILIEKSSIIPGTGTGYNSSDYEYKLFTVVSTDPNIGGENGTISYYIGDVLEGSNTPGTFDPLNSIASAVPEKFFPKFNSEIKKKEFYDREIVKTNDGFTGTVVKWDEQNSYLKVNSVDNFTVGSLITGDSSRTNAFVEEITRFKSKYSVDSSSVVKGGFAKETGFLNNDLQKLSDNDYYQNFAYAVKSTVPLDIWDDAVQSLNHTLGFKKFSDLSIESKDANSIGIATAQDGGLVEGINDIVTVIDLNCVNDFDLASEITLNINGELNSETVIFDSRILQDYSEAVSNRVLVIDDISNQFEDRPRVENYSVVEEFDLDSAISRKYLTFVQDKRFSNKKQLLFLSLLQDGVTGYINQYGRLFTDEDLGNFDYQISSENKGQLVFYPTNYAVNDYLINVVSYNLGYFDIDNYSASFDLGDTVQIKANQIEFVTGITTSIVSISSTYRASKVFVQVDSGNDLEFNELTVIHDGTNVSILEYGQITDQTSLTSPGLGTFSGSITGSNLVLQFTPNSGIAGTITTLRVSIANTSSSGVGTDKLRNSELDSRITSIASTSSPGISTVSSYVQENLEEKYNAAYFIVSVEDKTNSESEIVEVLTIDDGTNAYITEYGNLRTSSGLGTFGVGIANSITNLHFTPKSNIDVEVRVFKHAIGTLNPPNSNGIISIDQASLIVGSGAYIGTSNVNTTFGLYHKNNPIFEREFVGSSSTVVSIADDTIFIPNHYFVTGEEIEYRLPENTEEQPIGIATTSFVGIGTTDKLPSLVYAIKQDDRFIKLATSAENALKDIPLAIDITSVGIGSRHKFIAKNQNSKSLVTIDNVIQAPVYNTTIKTSLASTATVFVDTLDFVGVSSFAAGNLIKINNEIMKIQSISGTSVGVLRYRLGTELERHGLGSTITKLNGNYNIVDNNLTFDETPYGERPLPDPQNGNELDWVGVTTHSTFSGRIFTRSGEPQSTNKAYYDNIIYDDISSNFNGITTTFILKSDGQNVTGVTTNNPIVLIDNIFQNIQRVDTAIDVVGNYDLDENHGSGISTIMFLGQTGIQTSDINVSRIPYGGVLYGLGSTEGFGYQPLISAGATISVSIANTITSISIGNSGSGYRSGIQTTVNVYAKNSYTLENRVSIGTAAISLGRVVGIAITNPSPTGIALTEYPIVGNTFISTSIGVGSTILYISNPKYILIGDYVSVDDLIINALVVGVASTSITIGSGSTIGSSITTGETVYIKKFASPDITFDSPVGYARIPLVYSPSSTSGVGTGAYVDIIVGQGSSVIDFNVVNSGFGYKEGEILTIPSGGSVGIPTDLTKTFKEFQIFVDKTFNNDFSAWSLGELQLIDDISGAFNGSRTRFTLKVDGKTTSFTTRKGSNIDIQATLLVFLNDILQVPGEAYFFTGGSVITFAEPPKGANEDYSSGGDTCKILYYRGTKDVDVVDVDILETIKIGDDITLTSDEQSLEEEERLVTLVDSTSSVETNAYSGPGVTTDPNLQRPVYWCRQTEDRIVNGREVGKDRILYEPIINPLTNIISNVGLTTSYVYVSSVKPFFNSSKENIGSRFANKIEIYNPEEVLAGASASITVSAAGTITNISIASSGRGYSSAPAVIIGEPYGIGKTQRATATSTITSGFVTTITLVNPGAGYSYGGVSNVSISNTFFGQGWPTLSTDTYSAIRLSTDIGTGFNAIADIKIDLINKKPLSLTIVESGNNYQVGDVLSVSRIGEVVLSTPAQFFVTEIEKPIVFIEPPDVNQKEIIEGVTFEGDYGIITGVASTSVGVASTGLVFDLFIPEYSVIRDGNINTGIGTTGVSGLGTGYYFVVTNSNIGSGITSYDLSGNVIGVGTSCIDNIYQVADIQYANRNALGVGSTNLLRVTVNVSNNSISGLGSSDFFGEFSWGRIYTPSRKSPKEHLSNGFSGIDTSPVVRRLNPLKYELYRL